MQVSRLRDTADGSDGRTLLELTPAELRNIAAGLTTGGNPLPVIDPDSDIKRAIAAALLRQQA